MTRHYIIFIFYALRRVVSRRVVIGVKADRI